MKNEALDLNLHNIESSSFRTDFETFANQESEDLQDPPHGFWKRQFLQEPTKKQKIFDWAYGVVVPLICVAADPIVFRTFSGGPPFGGAVRPFAYLLSAVSILAMAAWLLWGTRLGWIAAPLAGLFFVGAAVSLAVGLILAPISVIGFFFVIGVLGFTPLLSSIVYLRNGVRAYRSALTVSADEVVWRAAVLAAVFSVVTPYVVNIEISKLVNEVVRGDVHTIQQNSLKLRILAPLVDPSPIARRYFNASPDEPNSPRMQKLAEAYKEISGVDIKDSSYFLF